MREILAGAVRHGLDVQGYAKRISNAEFTTDRDRALSETALAYANALARGAIDPAAVYGIFTLPRNQVDVVGGLNEALARGELTAWFESLAPRDPAYEAISRAYVEARQQIGSVARPRVPAGPPIRPGDHDPRVRRLAEALHSLGFSEAVGPGEAYGPRLVRAVKALQAWGGVDVDGVVGSDTLRVLSAGHFERARRLAVNLERRRWLARLRPASMIEVNIPAAMMRYFSNGELSWRARVIAGAPGHATPQLGENFDQLILNPPWYVPRSIAQAEILPKGGDYLRANNMYIQGGRVVQRPGPGAALGRVKFDMQNPYAIYLHDTPSKSLFESDDRHRSHGCVRIEDAVAFARELAEAQSLEAEFDALLATGETQSLRLAAPVAVRLVYHTADLQDVRVRLWPDVYGWDDRAAEALGLGDSGARRSRSRATVLLGP